MPQRKDKAPTSAPATARAAPATLRIGSEDLQRMRVPKAAELVSDALRWRIITGELKAGDVLATEAELVAQFNVARGTLREAIRILEAESLVATSRGTAGVRVCAPDASAVSRLAGFLLQFEGATLGELYTALLAIEPAAVEQLANSRPAEAITELAELVAQIDATPTGDPTYPVLSSRFHERLVALGGGRAMALFARIAFDLIRARARELDRDHREHRDNNAVHAEIVTLIRAGRASKARDTWRAHLEESVHHLGAEAQRQVLNFYGS
jgi:DNA-binding FadR family transcriptional regulator